MKIYTLLLFYILLRYNNCIKKESIENIHIYYTYLLFNYEKTISNRINNSKFNKCFGKLNSALITSTNALGYGIFVWL